VPTRTIVEALAYINWTVLAGLAVGCFSAVVWLRLQTDATRGYLAFSAILAAVLGGVVVLDGALDQLRQTWVNLTGQFAQQLTLRQQRFIFLSNQVMMASPTNRLKQGYSIVTNRAGTVIKDKKAVKKDEQLSITLHQGMLTAKVQ